MKLAHLADLHLGFRQYYRLTPNGVNQREADVAQAFGRAIDDLVQVEPDLILLAGDLFHSVRPTNAAILHAFNQLRRLRVELPGAEIIIVAGNHDTPRSVETGSILRLFEALGGIHVVATAITELVFDHLDLSVVCVPHAALMAGQSGISLPGLNRCKRILVTHGEIAGALSRESSNLEYGGALVEPGDLQVDSWDYVALGHYHVASKVATNAWYCGALEYVSTNPWGELLDEAREGRRGRKGWLLVQLEEELQVEFRPVPLARNLVDLEPIQGDGLGAADLDRVIAERVASVPDGIADNIVRQVVFDVPRPIARDMDQQQIREFKAKALHYNLDIRRPPTERTVGIGAPGRRQTLSELVSDYLSRRVLTAEVDRKELMSLAAEYMNEVEQDLLEE
ncbi:MAG: exonuclease SbcCD subunit D [Gemmatimonadota bacterium]|nr:MAG: exonuclease SbcCD subunit D [Gemmatimonadota bacterium]